MEKDNNLNINGYLMTNISILTSRIRTIEETNVMLVSENNKLYNELNRQKLEFKKLLDVLGNKGDVI